MSNARTLANTINSSSQIVVPSGGIAFTDLDSSNDSATANEAYVLGQDGYETGTWTPEFVDSTGNNNCAASNAFNGAYYTKIGNQVTCSLRWNTSAGTGVQAHLDGLPFAPSGTSGKAANVTIIASDNSNINYWRVDSTSRITLVGVLLNQLASPFRVEFTYFTD